MMVLYTYMGHLLHAFSALVSFSSDDLNKSFPRRATGANSKFASTSGDWRVVSRHLFVAAVLIGC